MPRAVTDAFMFVHVLPVPPPVPPPPPLPPPDPPPLLLDPVNCIFEHPPAVTLRVPLHVLPEQEAE